jgi:hypothetical protein
MTAAGDSLLVLAGWPFNQPLAVVGGVALEAYRAERQRDGDRLEGGVGEGAA